MTGNEVLLQQVSVLVYILSQCTLHDRILTVRQDQLYILSRLKGIIENNIIFIVGDSVLVMLDKNIEGVCIDY